MKVNDVTTTVLTVFHDESGITYREERVAVLDLFARIASSRLNYLKKMESLTCELKNRQEEFSKLRDHSGLEHAISVIAAQFISISPQKIDKAIKQALQVIAEKNDIDFCYLALVPRNVFSNLPQPLKYSSESSESKLDDSDFTRKTFDWCLDRLNQFEVVHIPSATNLSPKDQQAKPFLQSKSIQSFLALPLISNRLVIGFMGCESRKTEKNWSAEIIALFRVCADIFVNALQRKWDAYDLSLKHEQTLSEVQSLEKRSYETGLITEMGDLLQSCRTADEAYPIISRYIQKMIPNGSGALYMIQHAQDPAERVATWGNQIPSPLENELLLNECWALRRGRVYVVTDPLNDPICGHVKEPKDVGYMCVPLIAQGVAIGVLHFRLNEANADFPEDRQEIVIKISEIASMALTNLKLRDELRAQAIRDPLTGLFNRRYMEETLEREIRRAQRHGTSVGVIMFDIDKMKPINDTFGHDAGDLVLRALGEELLRLFRSEDVACRYGGDEFTIVLPEASLADAWLRAEQMRDTIKNLSLQYEGHKLESITLSIGVAAFPDHGPTADSLLLASDAGSYTAKSEGGDRIMVGHRDDTGETIQSL